MFWLLWFTNSPKGQLLSAGPFALFEYPQSDRHGASICSLKRNSTSDLDVKSFHQCFAKHFKSYCHFDLLCEEQPADPWGSTHTVSSSGDGRMKPPGGPMKMMLTFCWVIIDFKMRTKIHPSTKCHLLTQRAESQCLCMSNRNLSTLSLS